MRSTYDGEIYKFSEHLWTTAPEFAHAQTLK